MLSGLKCKINISVTKHYKFTILIIFILAEPSNSLFYAISSLKGYWICSKYKKNIILFQDILKNNAFNFYPFYNIVLSETSNHYSVADYCLSI